jgi:hypothetical protein
MPRFRPTARLILLDPAGLSDLVDRLVSDGVPAAPVRLPWGLRM